VVDIQSIYRLFLLFLINCDENNLGPKKRKSLWQILEDFVADSVADTKKPLEYQGVMRS